MEKGKFILNEHKDGGISLSYEDYDVEFLGGSDYEVNYSLNAENANKLRSYLSAKHTGTLEEMIAEEFGISLDKKSFSQTCKDEGIAFELFTWSS